ncbi:glycosyltransferase family 2 protein [Leucobacter manosquensis]|uniref:Glycosyltransferase family 2 protein n=1 Tax=Leucobacter manosquensis TaxID=2810611 RepID=A0ABS5M4C6_9MICO|nr:glycosyltransferase family 2 protein [Leucobacter manosquensis]MBS3182046.1 glycosyltransferase family 2 protein [Leucobacter manosquensis]
MRTTPGAVSPAIDICIPHWGEPDYLREAIASVIAQTDPRWHLTIIDDAYPGDAARELVASFDDSRIAYVKKEHNEGITANFRSCVAAASTGLVTVMGNDDQLLPEYVATILRASAVAPEADIIQPGVRVIDAEGAPAATLVDSVKQRLLRPRATRPVLLAGDRLGAGLMHGDWLYWPSLTFRTEAIRAFSFRDEFAVIQDLALLMDMFFAGKRLLVVPDEVFAYRRHDESASSLLLLDGSRFAGERSFFRLAASLAQRHRWPRTRRAARLHLTSRAHALSLAPGALLRGKLAAVGRMLRHAFGP